MTEVIWVWTIEPMHSGPPPDITGWDVVARDGDIGTVDEATYETGSGCVVVDTGRWIFGKRRMLPAGLVNNVDLDNRRIFVSCTKKEVKDAPDYDDEQRANETDRDDLGRHYFPSGETTDD